MKIEIDSKKVFINSGNNKEEIHPFWLRERINNEDALDKENQQRLTKILKKTNDFTKMTLDEYEIYIDDYTKKSKYPEYCNRNFFFRIVFFSFFRIN